MQQTNFTELNNVLKSTKERISNIKTPNSEKRFIYYHAKNKNGQPFTVIIKCDNTIPHSVLVFPEIKQGQTIETFPVIIDLNQDNDIVNLICQNEQSFLFGRNGVLDGVNGFIYRTKKTEGMTDARLFSQNYIDLFNDLNQSLANYSAQIPADFEESVIKALDDAMEGDKIGRWTVGNSTSDNYPGIYLGIGNDTNQFRLAIQNKKPAKGEELVKGKELVYLRYTQNANGKKSVERTTYIAQGDKLDMVGLYNAINAINNKDEFYAPYFSNELNFEAMKERQEVCDQGYQGYQGYQQGFESQNDGVKENAVKDIKEAQKQDVTVKDVQINSSATTTTKSNASKADGKKSGGIASWLCCGSKKAKQAKLTINGDEKVSVNNEKGKAPNRN